MSGWKKIFDIGHCGHLVCITCACQWVLNALEDQINSTFPLCCPKIFNGAQCTTVITTDNVRKLVGLSKSLIDGPVLTEENFSKFEELSVYHSLPATTRIICPNLNCSKIMLIDFQECQTPRVLCLYCSAPICIACKIEWHNNQTCAQSKLQRSRANTFSDEVGSKNCPVCDTRITHFYGNGCHHIMPGQGCPVCHTHFCYVCLTHPYTYSHKINGVTCPVFCDETCGCPICSSCRGAGCTKCTK